MKKKLIISQNLGEMEKKLNEQYPEWDLIQVDQYPDYSVSAWIQEPNYKLYNEIIEKIKYD